MISILRDRVGRHAKSKWQLKHAVNKIYVLIRHSYLRCNLIIHRLHKLVLGRQSGRKRTPVVSSSV